MRALLAVTICLIAQPVMGQVFLPPAVFQDEARAKRIEAFASLRKSTAESVRIFAERSMLLEQLRHQRVMNRIDEGRAWVAFRSEVRAARRRGRLTYPEILSRRYDLAEQYAALRQRRFDLVNRGVMRR